MPRAPSGGDGERRREIKFEQLTCIIIILSHRVCECGCVLLNDGHFYRQLNLETMDTLIEIDHL